jgi:hypothetical protein
MQGNDALTAVLPVIATLERLDVPYYVGGSIASSAHGIMRATADADLVTDLKPQHVDPLVDALKADYYIDARMIRGAIADRSCCNLIHLATSFKVDIFVLKGRPYDRAALARKEKRSIGEDPSEAQLYLATAEDTILAKLEWYRLGNEISDRQWRDIIGILKLQRGRLDMQYLKKWAAALKVADLLDRVFHEAD